MKFRLSSFKKSEHNNSNLFLRIAWYIFSISFFENKIPFPSFIKRTILIIFGGRIGKGFVIKPSVQIKYPWNLKIGDYVWIGEKVWIDNVDKVVISNNVCISQGVMIETGNHNFKSKGFELITSPVYIEENVWVGFKSTVLPGTTIRKNSVYKAASVIDSKLNPYRCGES